MSKLTAEVVINNPQGIHARPAALFVQITSKYNSQVTISFGGQKVNGKSIMGILTLGAHQHSKVTLEVDGEDAEAVLAELIELLSRDEIK